MTSLKNLSVALAVEAKKLIKLLPASFFNIPLPARK
jgi:hypothetical protein